MKIQKPTKSIKRPIIVTLIVALVAVGAWIAYAYTQNAWPFAVAADDTTAPVNTVNYDPPTEEEIGESQNAKERLLKEGEQSDENTGSAPDEAATQGNKKPVTVGISYASVTDGQLEIRAFSPSVVTGTGTCTAAISKQGSATITKSVPAFVDVSSTICEPIYIPQNDLTSGTWNVSVTFSSPTHEGSSGITQVEVR